MTHNVCHDSLLFESFTSSKISHVSLPNGAGVIVSKIGKVRLSDYILPKNVLFIPSFKYNLISVSSLTKYFSCSCMFFSAHWVI